VYVVRTCRLSPRGWISGNGCSGPG